MRSVLVVLAAIVATVAAGGPAAAQNFRKPPSADKASALRLAEGQATESRSTKVYVVQMAAKPGISYEGGAAGFARTAPEAGAKYDARSSQAQMYTEHLVAQQDSLLAAIGARGRKLYSYTHALNGFAARLTAGQAATLRKNEDVLNVWEDRRLPVDTNNSPTFLGLLDPKNGLRAKRGLRGKGVIIGMLDTGAVQEHPSFDDTGFDPPTNWNGVCQAGEGWNANDCNNKLIGARYFISG
ncbi:MAG: S8 family serine peptidase, partial [Steroidobacteraceae bacterium]